MIITPTAAIRIKQLVQTENDLSVELSTTVLGPPSIPFAEVIGLRVAVAGGGCSGFSYSFDYVEIPETDDSIFEQDGSKVFIDPVSLQYLVGATLDYKKSLVSEQFIILNPNAKSSCGCGQSFNT
jgi:iron-sulfur cluster assembly accessory protein